jgi:hypothetical protein
MPDHRDILSFHRLNDDSPPSERNRSELSAVPCRQPFAWQDLNAPASSHAVRIELGRTTLVGSAGDLAFAGALVKLDSHGDDTVDIVVAGQVIAYGRLVVVQGKLAVEICQVVHRLGRHAA